MMEEEEALSSSGDSRARRQFLREMIIVDLSYLTGPSWFGRVKILQFLFVILAGIMTPSVTNGFLFSRYAFFVFIVWTSFMYISLDLLLHLTSLWRRLPQLMTASAILVFPLIVGVVVFLIGSSLIASASHTLRGSQYTTSALSATCGYFVMILYGVEAYLHFKLMNSESQGTTPAVNLHPARNRPISHPVTVEIVNPYPPPYKDIVTSSEAGPPAGNNNEPIYEVTDTTFH